jgi:hypothetical protein
MKSLKISQFNALIFLELASITPLLIILGNIIPPFPLKVHHIGLGLLFLVALWTLLNDGYKRWLIYTMLGFTLVQFYQDGWYLKGLIDYFFGPFVLVVMLDIVVNKRIPLASTLKYEKRFHALLWLPALIAALQYFNLLPITCWNATYVNFAYFGDLAIPRPNGFLYHGSELSVIIAFLVLFQFFNKENRTLWRFIFLLLIAAMTYFKALFGCVALLVLYYLFFVNRGVLSKIRLIPMKQIVAYSVLLLLVLAGFAFQFFKEVYAQTGYVFPSGMLTGRGAIWNIYLERIKDFTWYNYLFGNGMGTSFDIFADYATPKTWWKLAEDPNTDLNYDSHNAVLSVFINSGLIGIAFFIFLFKLIWNQIKQWLPGPSWNKRLYWGIVLIPLMTIGVTIPIYENAIFWLSTGFLLMRWKRFTETEHEQTNTK